MECPRLLTTLDAGETFVTLPVPVGPFGPEYNHSDPAVSGIRFANAEDGWLFGPHLYATHDGGRHWRTLAVPGSVADLEPGADRVFAIIDPDSPCSRTGHCTRDSPSPRLWATAANSDRWRRLDDAGEVSEALTVHGRSIWVITGTQFADGTAIGDQLRHSADDGDHFITEPEQIGGIVCTYSPATTAVIWSYCSGGHFMYAARSADGGAHFVSIGPEDGPATSPNGDPNGSSLKCADTDTALVANSHTGSPIIRTRNRGKTWQIVEPALTSGGTWTLIGFTTPEVGYAYWYTGYSSDYRTNDPQLWRTHDAGSSWSRVLLPSMTSS